MAYGLAITRIAYVTIPVRAHYRPRDLPVKQRALPWTKKSGRFSAAFGSMR
jgi:hypothetical protein